MRSFSLSLTLLALLGCTNVPRHGQRPMSRPGNAPARSGPTSSVRGTVIDATRGTHKQPPPPSSSPSSGARGTVVDATRGTHTESHPQANEAAPAVSGTANEASGTAQGAAAPVGGAVPTAQQDVRSAPGQAVDTTRGATGN